MIRLLDGLDDRGEWLQRWKDSGREPFAHPSYVELFTRPSERAAALLVEQTEGSALVPIIVRPMRDLMWVDEDWHDVTSPYGYGGPFCSGSIDHERLVAEVETWLKETEMCSAFLRLSIDVDIAAGQKSETTHVVEVSQNVVVDLTRAPDAQWTNYEHKVRKNVRKARRVGCTVLRRDNFDELDEFLTVYSETMRRRNADAWYHFDAEFFGRLRDHLAGSYSVFYALDANRRVVSVELVLESENYLYSFLGGTLEEAYVMAPNDLLKHEIIAHGMEARKRGFVLGGGYRPDDGIFRYKRSFDRSGVRPFLCLQTVGSPERFEKLLRLRSAYGPGSAGMEGFFPAYRAP